MEDTDYPLEFNKKSFIDVLNETKENIKFSVCFICDYPDAYITGNVYELGNWNTFFEMNDGIFMAQLSGEIEYKYKTLTGWEQRENRKLFIDSDCIVSDFYGEKYSIVKKEQNEIFTPANFIDYGNTKFFKKNKTAPTNFIDYGNTKFFKKNKTAPTNFINYGNTKFFKKNKTAPTNFINYGNTKLFKKEQKQKNICVSGQTKKNKRISKAHFRNASDYIKNKYTAVSGYTTKNGTKVKAYKRKK